SVRPRHRLTAPRPRWVDLAGVPDHSERTYRSVHLPVVDRDPRGALVVRAPRVEDVGVVIRAGAPVALRIGEADVLRDAVGSPAHAEVMIERPVLMYDDAGPSP